MKITRGWCCVTGDDEADKLRAELSARNLELEKMAELQAEVSKMTERRDRWRNRAETAGELAAEMRSQRDAARAEAAHARRKALTVAAETVAADAYKWAAPSHRAVMLDTAGKLRSWAEAEAPNWQATINAETTNADRVRSGLFVKPETRDGTQDTPNNRIDYSCYRGFAACGYTKVEGDRDLLAAILAAVQDLRTSADGIRDDLALMGSIR